MRNDPIQDLFGQKLGDPSPPPLILAPMAGVTDAPFRIQARRYGADLTVSEMLASQALIRSATKSRRMTQGLDESAPLAVQIAGDDPGVMAEAARLAVDRGAAWIDINMGCPVKKIVNNHAGCALMRDEVLVGRIVSALVQAVPVPVSVKIRLGWDESQRNAPQVARIAQDAGARLVTVHGRTRAQMYRGRADWSMIGEVVAAVSVPVVANGDIVDGASARQALAASGARGLMIGRGALGRPWVFRQVRAALAGLPEPAEPSREEQHQVVREQFDAMVAFYGPAIANRQARKHLAWYARGHADAARYRDGINRCGDVAATRALMDAFYGCAAKGAGGES
ncbi:MAG: tRNA dihydrouridine synthase DusB [Magnetococcus sp. WYHC-3]